MNIIFGINCLCHCQNRLLKMPHSYISRLLIQKYNTDFLQSQWPQSFIESIILSNHSNNSYLNNISNFPFHHYPIINIFTIFSMYFFFFFGLCLLFRNTLICLLFFLYHQQLTDSIHVINFSMCSFQQLNFSSWINVRLNSISNTWVSLWSQDKR